MSHTPGPWKVHLDDSDGWTVLPILAVVGEYDEAEADARLIAAATSMAHPCENKTCVGGQLYHRIQKIERDRLDLLAAMKEYVDYYSGNRAAQLGNGQARKSLERFRAAIAKAEEGERVSEYTPAEMERLRGLPSRVRHLGPATDEHYCGVGNPFGGGGCVKISRHDVAGDRWHMDQDGCKWAAVAIAKAEEEASA